MKYSIMSTVDQYVMNKLIPSIERRGLDNSAKVLVLSDLHDSYFFEKCRKLANVPQGTCVIPLGTEFALVKLKDWKTEELVEVINVKEREPEVVTDVTICQGGRL